MTKRALVALLLWPTGAFAQAVAVPPCGIEHGASYPAVDAAPIVKYLRPADVANGLDLSGCTGWTGSRFSTIVTTTARFRATGGADSLLKRIGAISELAGVRYWSASRKSWQQLILAAVAVTGPKDKTRRPDFTPNDIRSGDAVYFQQTDNLAGKAVYQMRVTSSSADHVVVTVENAAAIRYAFLTLFHPGEMQSIYFFDRELPDVWRYYGITRTGEHASGLLSGHPESSINRAVAFYRHYARIATDMEPPAAR